MFLNSLLSELLMLYFYRIRLKSLNSTSNIQAVAQQLVAKCNLIHPSKIPEVEQLLYYLQKRKDTGANSVKTSKRSFEDYALLYVSLSCKDIIIASRNRIIVDW